MRRFGTETIAAATGLLLFATPALAQPATTQTQPSPEVAKAASYTETVHDLLNAAIAGVVVSDQRLRAENQALKEQSDTERVYWKSYVAGLNAAPKATEK